MQVLPIPINIGANKDIEEIGLASYGAAAVDVFIDSNGNINRRPALVELCDLSVAAGIDGLFWWDRQSKVIVVVNGRTFAITDSDGTSTEWTSGTDAFQTGYPVYWGDFGTNLYGANGGAITQLTSAGVRSTIGGSAPTTVSHLAVINDRLLALETGTQRMHYSDASAAGTFSGNWVSALEDPDLLKFIGVGNSIVELMGTRLIEGWRDDGSTPFVHEGQYTIARGLAARHSPAFIEDRWYFLDAERKVLRLNGRTPEVISLTMNKYIQDFTTVSDAIGGHTTFSGRPQYILSFPTEGKTLAYDIYNGIWTELGKWNTGTSSYDQFLGQAFCIATAWNMALVGDRTTGKIYKFATGSYQDDSTTLRSMIRTPHIHWDYPGLNKRSYRLDFYLKKASVATASDSAELIVKWRDNGATPWGTERTVSLGRVGKTDFHGYLNRLGMYKTRQYEFALTDNSPLVLVKVVESFKVNTRGQG